MFFGGLYENEYSKVTWYFGIYGIIWWGMLWRGLYVFIDKEMSWFLFFMGIVRYGRINVSDWDETISQVQSDFSSIHPCLLIVMCHQGSNSYRVMIKWGLWILVMIMFQLSGIFFWKILLLIDLCSRRTKIRKRGLQTTAPYINRMSMKIPKQTSSNRCIILISFLEKTLLGFQTIRENNNSTIEISLDTNSQSWKWSAHQNPKDSTLSKIMMRHR
jgi:hypothetical protein